MWVTCLGFRGLGFRIYGTSGKPVAKGFMEPPSLYFCCACLRFLLAEASASRYSLRACYLVHAGLGSLAGGGTTCSSLLLSSTRELPGMVAEVIDSAVSMSKCLGTHRLHCSSFLWLKVRILYEGTPPHELQWSLWVATEPKDSSRLRWGVRSQVLAPQPRGQDLGNLSRPGQKLQESPPYTFSLGAACGLYYLP